MDGFAIAYTALAKLAFWHAVKSPNMLFCHLWQAVSSLIINPKGHSYALYRWSIKLLHHSTLSLHIFKVKQWTDVNMYNLFWNGIWKLHCFHQSFTFVWKTVVLIGRSTLYNAQVQKTFKTACKVHGSKTW